MLLLDNKKQLYLDNKKQTVLINQNSLENPWNTVKRNNYSRSPNVNKTNKQIELRNKFKYLQTEEVDFNLEEPDDDVIDINKSTKKVERIQRHNENNNKNRPNICITENYLLNENQSVKRKPVRPGMRTYADTAIFGKKVLIIGDSHLKRINRNKLKSSFKNAKCIMKAFGGAKIEELNHYITPHLEFDKPDIVVIHIGSNNVSYNNLNANPAVFAQNIIEIGNKCVNYGVQEVVISSIFVKESIKLGAFIRKINDELRELCLEKNFHFISNDNIIRKHICGDGVHLLEVGTNILAANIVSYLNDRVLKILIM